MKKVLWLSILGIVIASCNTPAPLTGNPDHSTNTTGTTGSANMNKQLPDNSGITGARSATTDSTVLKKDSLPK